MLNKIAKSYRIIIVAVFVLLINGCSFQKPDYLEMISSDQLQEIMKSDDIFLVDVHVPKQRHIKGTDLFIPYNEVEKHAGKFPEDKNTAIYLYCEGGPMGNAAARTLHELGYQNLFNLKGGAKAWARAGYPFE